MAGGRIFPARKKKVLNNRQLTRQVRQLKGTEGTLNLTGDLPYNNVTLTPNTASLVYVGTVFSQAISMFHYIKFRFILKSALVASSVVRILIYIDHQYDPNDVLVDTDIFSASGNIKYNYATETVAFGRKKWNDKNFEKHRRVQILYDQNKVLIADTSNELIAFNKLINLYNARSSDTKRLGMLIQSDTANNVTVSADIMYTDLAE